MLGKIGVIWRVWKNVADGCVCVHKDNVRSPSFPHVVQQMGRTLHQRTFHICPRSINTTYMFVYISLYAVWHEVNLRVLTQAYRTALYYRYTICYYYCSNDWIWWLCVCVSIKLRVWCEPSVYIWVCSDICSGRNIYVFTWAARLHSSTVGSGSRSGGMKP